jgi:hypothetical protein
VKDVVFPCGNTMSVDGDTVNVHSELSLTGDRSNGDHVP